jgi:hypothetical protein
MMVGVIDEENLRMLEKSSTFVVGIGFFIPKFALNTQSNI